MRRSSQAEGSICMLSVLCLCYVLVLLGNLTRRWRTILGYVPGTSNDRGKANRTQPHVLTYDLWETLMLNMF